MNEDINNEYHAKITGLPSITTKYHANTEFITTTRKMVKINIGVPNPNPCITRLLVIPIVMKG